MDQQQDKTPIVEVVDGLPKRDLKRRVRELLGAGEIVALPTETVYGLAARADDPAAVQRLCELKGRDPRSSLTWHAHDRAVVEQFEPLRPLARRLAARYWPGPLTLVLQGVPPRLEHVASDGWTGVRVPAHPATLALIEALDFPVVLSSANRHGAAPLTRAADVRELFGGALALVVDGGPSRLGESSGVLRLGRGAFELLREGILRLDELRRTAGLRIAFVCTGNTCRSPIAEALARAGLAARVGARRSTRIEDFGFEIASLGVMAESGAPASPLAIEHLAGHGLDLGGHRARVATLEALVGFDHVFAMTHGHLDALRALLPPGRHRSLELLDPAGRDIADPIHGGSIAYERTLREIEDALRPRLEAWA